MKPLEALQILDNVAQAFQGNRSDHVKLQTAIETLRSILPIENIKPAKSKPDKENEQNATS